MPYFMGDDQAPQNAKFKALTAPVLMEGDITGLAAVGAWFLAGCASQAALSDGLVSLADLVGVVPDRVTAEQLAHHLVDAGLWHTAGHDCPRCDPVPDRHYRFHDWWDLRYKPGGKMKVARAKARENKRPEVVNAVWLRDCEDPAVPARSMTAACRYCGKIVRRSDHTSPDNAPQLDHVDPEKAAGPSNLAVACGACNRRKGARTPAEAGMTLRPPPRPLTESTPAAETTVSPGRPAAETTVSPEPPTPAQDVPPALEAAAGAAVSPGEPAASQPARGGSTPSPKGPPTGAGARTSRPGQGQGYGLGSGEGSGSRSAQPVPQRSRRRRRGRGGKSRPAGAPEASPPPDQLDAGAVPLAFGPPSGGSPWHGWRGPRSPLSDENVCPIHHRHAPCDRCARGETP